MAYTLPLRFQAFANELPAEPLVTINTDAQGTLIGFNGTFAHVETNAPTYIGALLDSLKVTTPKINANAQELNPKRVPERNAAIIKQYVAPAYQAAIDGTIAADEELAVRIARFETLPPVSDATTEAAHRDAWHALPTLAAKLAALTHWPIPAIASVMRAGREVLGMDAAQFEIGIQRIREHNLVTGEVARTQFRLKPTLQNPAPRGIDQQAVKAFAESAQEQWKAKAESIALARSTLQHVAVLVAVMCSITPEAAFELLAQ